MANVTWYIFGQKTYDITGITMFEDRPIPTGTLYVTAIPEFVGRIPPVQEMTIPSDSISEFFRQWLDVADRSS